MTDHGVWSTSEQQQFEAATAALEKYWTVVGGGRGSAFYSRPPHEIMADVVEEGLLTPREALAAAFALEKMLRGMDQHALDQP